MKKVLTALSALVFLGVTAAVVPSVTAPVIAHAEEEVSEEIIPTYTDTVEYFTTTRLYDRQWTKYAVTPVKHFSAPAGYYLKLTMSDEQANFILNEMKKLSDDFEMLGVVIERRVNGPLIYAGSEWTWSANDDDSFKAFIKEKVESMVVLDMGSSTKSFIGGGRVSINLNDEFVLAFDLEDMEMTPYQDGDLITLQPNYYNDFNSGESRINLFCRVEDDLFNREYGLPTDGASWNEWHSGFVNGEYYNGAGWDDIYTIEFVADGVSLGKVGSTYTLGYEVAYDIEIEEFPTESLNIQAIVQFTSGGVEYTYKSKPMSFAQEDRQLFLDGYNNRTTVGVGVDHTYQVSVPKTVEPESSYMLRGYYKDADGEISGTFGTSGGSFDFDDEGGESGGGEIEGGGGMPMRIKMDDEASPEPVYDPYATRISFDKVGSYDLHMYALVATANSFIKYNVDEVITVQEDEPVYTKLSEALRLSIPTERIYATLNGDVFTISGDVASDLVNDGDEVEYKWSTSKNSIVDVMGDGSEITVAPINAGNVVLTLTCESDTFTDISKSLYITVINEATSTPTIDIADEFHKTGEDLTLKFNLAGYSDLINLNVDWTATNTELEEAAAFVDNGDGTITLTEPKSGTYEVVALVNGQEMARASFAVRQMDMQKFAKDNLIWIFLVMVAALAAFATLRVVISRKHSVEGKIAKLAKMVDGINPESPDYRKQLKNVRLMVLATIEQAEAINMENLNQYDEAVQQLRKAYDNIKGMIKLDTKLELEVKQARLNELAKTVNKALTLANELGAARDVSLELYRQAQNNNYVKEEKQKKHK